MVSKSLASTLYPNDATRVRCANTASVMDGSHSRPGRGPSVPATYSLHKYLQGTAAPASVVAGQGRLLRP